MADAARQHVALTETFQVAIISPLSTHYEGVAVSVSAVNKAGPFDVMSRHINFFSILQSCTVTVNTGTKLLSFPTEHGIIKVTDNVVTVFINLPEPVKN
jgi:F0F1-type ATP synthase epsilon subunit